MSAIEEVKSRLDIAEVIGQHVQLAKAGRNFKALCPFHTERTPSFIVSPERQSWHCFGACGEGGDVFSFVMKKEGLEFGQALWLLAEKAGVVLPERREEERDRPAERPRQANEAAAQYFQHLLLNSESGKAAREYLERRGIDIKTAQDFSLGYSPAGWETLRRYLGERGLAGKWLMHEESIRTPLIIRAPWLSETAGTQRNEMTLNIDLAPTMLSLAGVEIPTSMQGRDASPLVRGESPAWRKEWFYEHLLEHATIPKTEGVRGERWKYTRYVEADPVYEELYDLAGDPGEDRNIATVGEHRDSLERQRARWRAWREKLESWDGTEPWRDPVFEPVG